MTDETTTISRRRFVQASAGAAAAVPFALPAMGGFFAQGSDQLKVGLVGCGGRGTGAALNALRADPGNVLYAMGDAFDDRLEGSLGRLREQFKDTPEKIDVANERKFYGFDAYKNVIDACDVVLLVTPPHFRPMHLEAAIAGGCHVFAEKPLAVDGQGVRSVLATCEKAREKGLSVMSGFCWRHSAPTVAAMNQIHAGGVGEIRAVQTMYNTGTVWVKRRLPEMTDMQYQMRNWYYYTWLSGDHIVEQACHSIDKINWAMQGRRPTRCWAVGGRQCRPEGTGHIYDHFGVIYEYEDGARAYHLCRQFDRCPSDNTDYVMGSDGTCFINSWNREDIYITGRKPWKYGGPGNDMYQTEHDELFAALRAGEQVNDGEWMCTSTLMGIMGREAAYTGQALSWDQVLNSPTRLGPAEYDWDMSLPEPPVAMPGKTRFS
jgi:myo-inositol 2-dehydrogenase/D-chiro-inositol 1-dehydrogenase